jgi:hypothetical protein
MIVYVFVAGQGARDFTADSRVVGVSYMSPARSESIIEELLPTKWAGYSSMLRYESQATAEPELTEELDTAISTEDVTPEVTP